MPFETPKKDVYSQKELIINKFKKHKFAVYSFYFLIFLYITTTFAEFFSPYPTFQRNREFLYAPPSSLHFFDKSGKFSLLPFVYDLKGELDIKTFQRTYFENDKKRYHLVLLPKVEAYGILFFTLNRKFIGIEDGGQLFFMGTDGLGRDIFSRTLYGIRTSLYVGLVGLFFGLILGLFFGGISGYYGGSIDNLIQRFIEFIQSLPTLPLWMALATLVPPNWSPIQVYFSISIVLAIIGWTGLARVVRGKLISLREEDYVLAAKVCGARESDIILKHLLPGFSSYLIVHLTLAIPSMILGETSLSFLGLGIRPPAVSLGTLLQDAQNVQTVTMNPWLLFPGMFVIIIVLAFNFLGDGIRDATDPYKHH
jgi:peptide/nickel transport system permease protein